MAGINGTPADDRALRDVTTECLNLKPIIQYAVRINELKANLKNKRPRRNIQPKPINDNPKSSQSRQSPRIDERQKLEISYKQLSGDIKNLYAELDVFFESINEICDHIQLLHEKIDGIDKKLTTSNGSQTYADVARVNSNSDVPTSTSYRNKRIEKLEYQSSEQERINRVLQVTITHPSLDLNNPDLFGTAYYFMENIMKMGRREIDMNMYVQQTRRPHTVLITLSERRFKSFLFRARKNLPQQQIPIYINDYLTNYNYSILKLAKEERKRSFDNLNVLYEIVYTYNGRVFIKKRRSDPPSAAILVKSPENLHEIMEKLAEDNQPNN